RRMRGLRLVVTKRIPNPWAEAAKALFHVKGIPYVRVAQRPGAPNDELRAWTGQTSAPVAVLDDEPPRTTWSAIVHLAERLAPEPTLIPADAAARATMFGYLHELCGEMGFGWCRRLAFAQSTLDGPNRFIGEYIVGKYSNGVLAPEVLRGRVRELLALFAELLREQRARGRRFMLGDRLTALDLYWAAFAALIDPLPPAQCAMLDAMRPLYTLTDPELRASVDPILMEHRDRIYADYLPL